MASRGQSLSITYVAWDTSAGAGRTGDSGNHTLRWIKDGTSAAPSGSPTEVDSTNAPGIYKITLTTTECTCHVGTLAGASSTSDVVIIPVTVAFEQLPTALAGANGGLPTVDSNNRIAGIQGTKNDLDDLNDIDGSSVTATSVSDKTGYGLATTERDSLADAVLARSVAHVEATAAEHSLSTIVLAMLESSIAGTTWTIKRTNGSTSHVTKTVTTDADADPITGVG